MQAEERRRARSSSRENQLPASEIWWRLLLAQIAQARSVIPAALDGVVQIEVERSEEEIAYFHLRVRGASTSGFDGLADRCDVRVSTSERDLEAVLSAPVPPRNALRASGDVALFRNLLIAVARAPQPRSMLALRGGR